MTNWLKSNSNWLKVLAILALLGALWSVPYYVYYQLMDWIVVGAAFLVAWQARQQQKIFLTWLFALVLVVFNPLAPLYLRPDIWQITDLVGAGLFLVSFFLL